MNKTFSELTKNKNLKLMSKQEIMQLAKECFDNGQDNEGKILLKIKLENPSYYSIISEYFSTLDGKKVKNRETETAFGLFRKKQKINNFYYKQSQNNKAKVLQTSIIQ